MAYLSEEQKAAYIQNIREGKEPYCPFCETKELPELIDGPERRINDDKIIRIWLCKHCDEAWTDVFTVVNGTPVITDVEYTEDDLNIEGSSTMLLVLAKELASVANDLDAKGVYEEARMIDKVLQAFKSDKVLIRKVAQLAENDQDIVSITPALLLRLMEYAKEEAADDVTLHRVLENVMAQGGTVISRDYENLIPKMGPGESADPIGNGEVNGVGEIQPADGASGEQLISGTGEGYTGEERESVEYTGVGPGYDYQIHSDSEGGQSVSIQGKGDIQEIINTLREIADGLDEKGEHEGANLVDETAVQITTENE